MLFCPNCGTAITQGTQFCGGCGGALSADPSVSSIPYGTAAHAAPLTVSPRWRFSALGAGPTVSWILYFAAIPVEALSRACQWGGGFRLEFLLSMAAAVTVVVGLGLAFKDLRSSGRQLPAILLTVGFSVYGLAELIRFISVNNYSQAMWNFGAFMLAMGVLTIGSGFFFLIFRPEKTATL